MSKLYEKSAAELNKGYQSHDISPVEVAEAVLGRIDEVDGAINAFCHLDAEATRGAARASEARWRTGQPLSRLDGVPVSIKDLLHVMGWPTRHGSAATSDEPSTFDSPAVARLRERGAVLLGKTATPEFGHKGVTVGPLTGTTSNPWNLDMTPGGSSGGAAAALAAGMGPLAIGTDGGGSCRKPANYCGAVGMKPSFGRVAAWPLSAIWPLSSAGPMGRTVEDVAQCLDVIAAPDPRDPYALPKNHEYSVERDESLRDLKIAFSPRLGGSRARQEVGEIVAAAVPTFAELGAQIEESDPGFADPLPIYRPLLDSGWALVAASMSAEQLGVLDVTMMDGIERGRAISGSALRAALAQRSELVAQMVGFHERYDLLVTPTNPTTAYPHGSREPVHEEDDEFSVTVCFTFPFNLTGQPAISVPCGFTKEGLPVGLQIVGPFGRDDLVLRAARAFESISGFGGQLAMS